ncbi:MAG: ATP cone domain-containing protein [bacterium]|nr:ATP cone domain-containing protein [bacterium]
MKESRIEYVRKRDGRLVPFNKQKIADAIFKAAQSVGGQDRYLAEDLAEVVQLYLEKEYKGDTPSVEEIQDIVERILIKTGHARTAKAYILYRQKRARARQIREGLRPLSLAEKEVLERELDLSVRRSDDRIGIWNRSTIVDVLVRETGISRNIAELIVAEVEEDVIASKVKVLTSSMIRELVNAKLILYGFEEERQKHSRIGLPLYDISSIFKSFEGHPDALSSFLGRRIKREFAMNAIIPQVLVERYLKGEISIANIEGIDKILTAYIPVQNVEEIENYYKSISPLIEGNVVFFLPDNITTFSCNGQQFLLEFPYRVIKEKQIDRKGSVIRIEDKDTFELLMREADSTPPVGIYKGLQGPLFVLNHISLNLPVITAYAEQEGVPLKERVLAILDKLVDMTFSQRELIENIPYIKDTLLSFTGYNTTMEVECEGWQEISECDIVSEVLSHSLSFFTNSPSEGLKRYFEEGIIARVFNG